MQTPFVTLQVQYLRFVLSRLNFVILLIYINYIAIMATPRTLTVIFWHMRHHELSTISRLLVDCLFVSNIYILN